MHFDELPRFEILSDGTVVARAGTLTNCAGIAAVHARICLSGDRGLSVFPDYDPAWPGNRFGPRVPGAAIPEPLRSAIIAGVATVVQTCGGALGIQYELLDALIDPVDGNQRRFVEAGARSLREWLRMCHPTFLSSDSEEGTCC